MEAPLLSLIVPTFNERDNLVPLVQRVHQSLFNYPHELIIVDDDSPDETWKLAAEMAFKDPQLKVIRRQEQRGLATAVVAGWREARGQLLGVMDGDLQHPPEVLPQLLKAVVEGPSDLAVASRYIPGGKAERWSLVRKIISRGAGLLARMILPSVLSKVRDPSSGYFVMKRDVIENIDLRPKGFKILIEVLARGHYNSVVEVPHPFEVRQNGKSKLGLRQYVEFLSHLVKLTWEIGELRRLCQFCIVGFSGVFVNLGVLWFLTDICRMYYLYSAVAAVECAIANNFVWNEFWTFADKTAHRRTPLHRLTRFLKFNAICIGGALLQIGTLWFLTDTFGLYYLMSATVGVAVSIGWNYSLNTNITWLSPATPSR